MLDANDLAQIHAEKAAYRQDVDAVRADNRLSHEGRVQRLAQLWTAEKRRVDAIRQAAAQRHTTAKARLRRQLFGISDTDASAAIAHRDATDRVADLNPTQLHSTMTKALVSGDTTLAKAAFERAHTRYTALLAQGLNGDAMQWRDAIAAYIEENPKAGDAAADLADLVVAEADPARNMRESMHTSVPKPPELESWPDHRIAELADSQNPDPAA